MGKVDPNGQVATAFYRYAVDYYVSGRAAFLSPGIFIAGILLHHAVEMLLKGQLSKTTTLKDLRDISHKLTQLWAKVKECFPSEDLSEFDTIIDDLNRFEEIRYPTDVGFGKGVALGFRSGPNPAANSAPRHSDRVYSLYLNDMDAFFARLFPLCNLNPKLYFQTLSLEGRKLLTDFNPHSENWLPVPLVGHILDTPST